MIKGGQYFDYILIKKNFQLHKKLHCVLLNVRQRAFPSMTVLWKTVVHCSTNEKIEFSTVLARIY